MMLGNARDALRRTLDRIVDPAVTASAYVGRHDARRPLPPRARPLWWPDDWARQAFDEIAARHDLEVRATPSYVLEFDGDLSPEDVEAVKARFAEEVDE